MSRAAPTRTCPTVFLLQSEKKSSKIFFAIFIFFLPHPVQKIPSDHFGAGVETTKAALIKILLRPGAK